MITLGLASNYSFGRSLRHLFAMGTKRSSQQLIDALASAYNSTPDQVALYHSGRSALAVALQILIERGDIAPGSPVIIPGLTCIAVLRGIKAAGCQPVFCDIAPKNLEYNYTQLGDLLAQHASKSPHFGCILVQNTLGITWDIVKLEQLAREHHFLLIEDLAHSAGRAYPDGRLTGTVGSATILSFGKGKAIDTICGGALVMREQKITASSNKAPSPLTQPNRKPRLAQRLRDRWYPTLAGLARATWRIGLGKALIAIAMKFRWIERSGDTALNVDTRLTHWQSRLALRQFRQLQSTKPGPLRQFACVRDRKQCLAELYQFGYKFDEIWYDTPVAPARAAAEANFPTADCPETVKIASQIINLPTWYPERKLIKAHEIITKYQIKETK